MNIPVILGVLIALSMLAVLAVMALDAFGCGTMRRFLAGHPDEPPPQGDDRDAP
ncbi:MAG: hypothetical protein KGK07_10685 [Chloroflexota bacterium]|nr:hypothetical protein [Chloroflexota bacterium]